MCGGASCVAVLACVAWAAAAPKSISVSDFQLNVRESTYTDKTLFIKDVLEDFGHKLVITAPRGFGKTWNLHMLKAFLQLEVDRYGNKMTSMKDSSRPIKDTPNYKLFQQLKIMDHEDLMKDRFGKYPVIHVDLKSVVRFLYFNETQDFFKEVLHEAFTEHSYLQNSSKLFEDEREHVKSWCSDSYVQEDMGSLMPDLEKLSKYLFKHFDRSKVVVLIDHYDSPIWNCIFDTDVTDEVFKLVVNHIQSLFNIKKDDFYVETFLLTGVSQIEESHFSNANVIKRYEFLNDHRFVPYYGLTEDETFDLLGRYTIDVDNDILEKVEQHYGGYVGMDNSTVINVWALHQYLQRQKLDHVWARNCDIPHLQLLLKIPDIRQKLELMLKGVPQAMELKPSFCYDNLLILRDLLKEPKGKEHLLYTTAFYSFMFQHGFFSYDTEVRSAISDWRRYVIPNEEVKEFLWKTLDE